MTRINLDTMLSPQSARVVQTVDDSGRVASARFDLSALPRVDAHLVGQPVAEVPRIVERLCGICPVAHHLAGIRALESLWGLEVRAEAESVRRLLHHGSVVDQLAVRLFEVDRDAALALRRVGKLAMRAAGSPGHFPVTAAPGGVAVGVDRMALDELSGAAPGALAVAQGLVVAAADEPVAGFEGPDVALVGDDGGLDLMGQRLRAVSAGAEVVVDGALAGEWPELVGESRPGDIAPRPVLLAGVGASYRVGPVAQLRVASVTTPLAESARQAWLRRPSVRGARAVLVLHALEVIAGLACKPSALADAPTEPVSVSQRAGTGIGWVESPRGLLVHRYESNAEGIVTAAQILTPTAQNEPWLAQMLAGATNRAQMEASIQAADPCLPCVSAPTGSMELDVVTETKEP